MMHVLFFGTSAFAVPSLERLIERGHSIVLCVTRPDRPSGRGLLAEPCPVKAAALRHRLPLSQPEQPQAAQCAPLGADVGVVAAYGQMIRKELLAVPRYGTVGVHPSLLPKYRGAAPMAWALLNGERATGVTIYRLNDRLDAGEMILRREVAIAPSETADALGDRLAKLGAQQLVEALDLLEAGRARFEPQDESEASFAPKMTKAQGTIDWRQPSGVIERLVRATVPWPGAATQLSGRPLKVWHVAVRQEAAASAGAPPGTVIGVTHAAITVATGDGALELLEVQPAGGRRMTVREFLAGHPVTAGKRLGVERQDA